MISPQNENKISKRKSEARFLYRANRDASEKWQRTSKQSHRHYRRSERQLTRQDLKLAARGNPWHDELDAIEAELAEAMMDDYHYYLGAERDWYEHGDKRDASLSDEVLDDDDWFDDRPSKPEPRVPFYADEEAWGLKYSHVDEDDSLMR